MELREASTRTSCPHNSLWRMPVFRLGRSSFKRYLVIRLVLIWVQINLKKVDKALWSKQIRQSLIREARVSTYRMNLLRTIKWSRWRIIQTQAKQWDPERSSLTIIEEWNSLTWNRTMFMQKDNLYRSNTIKIIFRRYRSMLTIPMKSRWKISLSSTSTIKLRHHNFQTTITMPTKSLCQSVRYLSKEPKSKQFQVSSTKFLKWWNLLWRVSSPVKYPS